MCRTTIPVGRRALQISQSSQSQVFGALFGLSQLPLYSTEALWYEDPNGPTPSPRRSKWGRKECCDRINRTILQPFDRYSYDRRKRHQRLNLKSIRLKIGLVLQEPALFAASILDDIAYGKDGATKAEATEAARVANVHAFISGLPEGYNTLAGEGGVHIS
ncbi:hypothetical protein RHMOL_Rhmol09G0045500 [Rhododendron molle]|uniref:Uncharacterized protein n=1 Tax=Rhododendron molle TaxID=49168 RepID=A0ACC0MAC6_RHOML|nr:hypothetical protein RHMOL_Rhmol09G0045500 [Rhododendron molle]